MWNFVDLNIGHLVAVLICELYLLSCMVTCTDDALCVCSAYINFILVFGSNLRKTSKPNYEIEFLSSEVEKSNLVFVYKYRKVLLLL